MTHSFRFQTETIWPFLWRSISSTFFFNVLGRLISFVLSIVLARAMGAEGFGVYVLVWGWLQLLLVFAKFGSDAMAMRYASGYKASNDWPLFFGHLRFGFGLIASKSVILVLGIGICLWLLKPYMSESLFQTFLFVPFLLPVLALMHFVQGVLRSFHVPVRGLVSNTVLRPLIQLAFVGLIVTAGTVLTPSLAMGAGLVAGAIALGICGFWLWRRLHGVPAWSQSVLCRYQGAEWYRYALLILFIASGDMIFRQSDVIMLGALAGAEEAGLYGAASRIAYFVIFGISAANFVVAPMISEFHETGEKTGLAKTLRLSSALIFAIALAISTVILAGGDLILKLFGTDFVVARDTLNILTISQLLVTIAGPIGSVMIMTGHERFTSIVFMITAILNIALNATLIPIYGKEGAAIATAVSFCFWNGVCVFYAMRHLKVNTTIFSWLEKR
jgi:O-antigen/teichoic acid export membrane protein